MEVLCPQRTCNKLHFLQPIKNNTRYYIVLNVECHDWGQKITVRSPLQVRTVDSTHGLDFSRMLINFHNKILGKKRNFLCDSSILQKSCS